MSVIVNVGTFVSTTTDSNVGQDPRTYLFLVRFLKIYFNNLHTCTPGMSLDTSVRKHFYGSDPPLPVASEVE